MNLETLSSEHLAELRDKVIATLNDPASVRQREVRGEIQRGGPSTARPQRPVRPDRMVGLWDDAGPGEAGGDALEATASLGVALRAQPSDAALAVHPVINIGLAF